MNRNLQVALAILAAGWALSLSSCSSCSTGLSPGGPERGAATSAAPTQFYTPPGAVYNVTYTRNTVRIDFPTIQKALRSVSSDGRLFLFDASDARLAGLTKGNVIFLEHIGVRRVAGILHQGSQIAVFTETPALTDFIQDGQIKFSMPVTFRRARAQVRPPSPGRGALADLHGWFGPPLLVYAEEEKAAPFGLHASGEANGWEFEVEGEPEGAEGLELVFEAAKKLSGLNASVKIKGSVENISTAFNAVVQGGKLQNFEYTTPLNGKINLTWGAMTTGANGGIEESRLKLPPFAKQVIDLYGLPLLFQVEANLIFKPGFGTQHDAAEGGLEVKYDGSGGIRVQGGDKTDSEGKLDGDYTLQPTTSESLAAHGIVLALDAPRVSISLGTDSVKEAINEAFPSLASKAAEELESLPFFKQLLKTVSEDFFKLNGAAYVQLVTEFDYASSGPLSLVPCKMTHLHLIGQAGVDGQLMAYKSQNKIQKQLFDKGYALAEPNSPICGQTIQQ